MIWDVVGVWGGGVEFFRNHIKNIYGIEMLVLTVEENIKQ